MGVDGFDVLQVAQMLVMEATRKHRFHKQQSGNVYQEMNQSTVFVEKIQALRSHLTQMKQHLPPST